MILIVFSNQLIAQVIKVEKKKGKEFFIVPKNRMQVIDWKLRRYEFLQENNLYTKKLLNQIRLAKIVSDSFSLSLQKNIFNLKNEVNILQKENIKLHSCFEDYKSLKSNYKKTKKKLLLLRIRDLFIIVILGGITIYSITN